MVSGDEHKNATKPIRRSNAKLLKVLAGTAGFEPTMASLPSTVSLRIGSRCQAVSTPSVLSQQPIHGDRYGYPDRFRSTPY